MKRKLSRNNFTFTETFPLTKFADSETKNLPLYHLLILLGPFSLGSDTHSFPLGSPTLLGRLSRRQFSPKQWKFIVKVLKRTPSGSKLTERSFFTRRLEILFVYSNPI